MQMCKDFYALNRCAQSGQASSTPRLISIEVEK